MNLHNRKVVLTGASGGIGNAIAKALAACGCHLTLVGRNTELLEQLSDQLSKQHPASNNVILAADLNSATDRSALANHANSWGADILINALGINQLDLLENMSDADINSMMTTNLITPMQLSKDFIPLLKAKHDSAIVNIGSIMGSIGFAGSTSYCSSKFGLRGFTEALRREMADAPINIIYFAPRATKTAINTAAADELNDQLGNSVDDPTWVAEELVKALQTNRTNTYLGWPEAFFVRLNSLLPNLVDKALRKQLSIIRQYATKQSS